MTAQLVIVEIKPLLDRLKSNSKWLYQKVPLEALVEAMMTVPVYCDCSEAMWHVVEEHLSPHDSQWQEVDSMMLESIEMTLEILMDYIYRELPFHIGTDLIEKCVFSHWLGRDSLVLKKTS